MAQNKHEGLTGGTMSAAERLLEQMYRWTCELFGTDDDRTRDARGRLDAVRKRDGRANAAQGDQL